MGELAGGELLALQQQDRLDEPRLTQWDAWGNRVDRIELTPLWQQARRLAAEAGVVATAYERKHGELLAHPPVRARLPLRPLDRRLHAARSR